MMSAKPSQSGTTSTEPVELSAHIDWISCTFPHNIQSKWRSVVLPLESKEFIEVKAHNGYLEAYQHTSGAIVQRNENRPDMGVHVIYSSKAIAAAEQEFGVYQHELLSYLMIGSRLTRLDVAFNIGNVAIDIEQLYKDVQAGIAKTKARTSTFIRSGDIKSEKNADTCYVGSMKKRKKLLRIYDKAQDLGLDTLLTRLELETHGQIAQSAGTMLKTNAPSEYPRIIAGMISGYVDFSDTHIGEFLGRNSVKLATPVHARGNTAKWLIETVAPTLARAMIEDVSVWFDFKQAVEDAYNGITGAGKNQGTG